MLLFPSTGSSIEELQTHNAVDEQQLVLFLERELDAQVMF